MALDMKYRFYYLREALVEDFHNQRNESSMLKLLGRIKIHDIESVFINNLDAHETEQSVLGLLFSLFFYFI